MIQFVIVFFPIFLAAILQNSLFPIWFSSGVSPEPLLMLVVFWISQAKFSVIWPRIIFIGLVADFFSFSPIGINVIGFSLTAFVLSSLAKRFLVSHHTWGAISFFALITAATLTNASVAFFWGKLLVQIGRSSEALIFLPPWDSRILLRLLFNCLFFVLIYRPMMRLEKIISRR